MKVFASLITLSVFFGDLSFAEDMFIDMHKFDAEIGAIDTRRSSSHRSFAGEIVDIGVSANLSMYKDSFGITRGPKEVNIFKKASMGTVLIATNNGIGSGAIVTNNGYIVTNEHVVEGRKKVTVYFKPIGMDLDFEKLQSIEGTVEKVSIKRDLALIKVDSIPASASPIVMALESLPDIGSDAHAIGHPRGQLWTYTRGL